MKFIYDTNISVSVDGFQFIFVLLNYGVMFAANGLIQNSIFSTFWLFNCSITEYFLYTKNIEEMGETVKKSRIAYLPMVIPVSELFRSSILLFLAYKKKKKKKNSLRVA